MKSSSTLRVAFPYALPASSYDPARIFLTPEYTFLEHVFSPLVELDPDGQIRSGVAEQFEWKQDGLHFVFRKDLKTIDGYPVQAEDAAFSLKRLIVITGNTHGNLKSLLCPNVALNSLSDSCPGIVVKGNTLILRPQGQAQDNMKRFLVPMLAAIDFAVIPKRSIDLKTFSIRDYRNTSGPYFVDKDSSTGYIVWKANRSHYHYNKNIPQVIKLIPSDPKNPEDSFRKFERNEVDVISTDDKAPIDKTIIFGQTRKDANLHVTMNIRTQVALFTQEGRKKLSPDRRFAIGKALKSIFVEAFSKCQGYEETVQYFPVFGEGGLEQEQVFRLNKRLTTVPPAMSGKGLLLRFIYMREPEKMRELIIKKLPGIEVEEGESTAFEEKGKNKRFPDIEISGRDTGYLEDIGLLSFAMSAGYFGLSKNSIEHWMQDYMSEKDKNRRIKKIRDLHLQALMEPVMIPMLSSPYVAVSRKPWEFNFPTFYSNTQYWLLRRGN